MFSILTVTVSFSKIDLDKYFIVEGNLIILAVIWPWSLPNELAAKESIPSLNNKQFIFSTQYGSKILNLPPMIKVSKPS